MLSFLRMNEYKMELGTCRITQLPFTLMDCTFVILHGIWL